jgi:hypothetical protein
MTQPANPQGQMNLHQQKLYALIVAGVALIGMILPWVVVDFGGFGGFGGRSSSSNGFGGWGLLTLLGIVGVVIASLMNDKMQTYDQTMKTVALCSFGAILLGAFIVFMQLTGNQGGGLLGGGIKSGIGLWICMIAGVAGLLWVAGIIKFPPKTPTPPPPSN